MKNELEIGQNILDMIKSSINQDAESFRNHFSDEMSHRINDAIEAKKQEIANNLGDFENNDNNDDSE